LRSIYLCPDIYANASWLRGSGGTASIKYAYYDTSKHTNLMFIGFLALGSQEQKKYLIDKFSNDSFTG